MKERKARVEDALTATRAAVEERIVPEGGVAYVRALKALESAQLPGEEQLGVKIVKRALEEPVRQIAINAGFEGSVVIQRVMEGQDGFGFNADTENYEDLVEAGVIDPTKVTRFALQNAASVAGLLLTTEAAVVEKPKKKEERPAMPPGGICTKPCFHCWTRQITPKHGFTQADGVKRENAQMVLWFAHQGLDSSLSLFKLACHCLFQFGCQFFCPLRERLEFLGHRLKILLQFFHRRFPPLLDGGWGTSIGL